MNIKDEYKVNQLVGIFQEKTGWNLARVKFLVYFICALCKLQTVNFKKLAQGPEGTSLAESKLRRIQRFFAGFQIDEDLIAKIIFSFLPLKPPYRLSLDRTNWKFGSTNINILAIGICFEGVAIPLMWVMLPKRGNSNQKERTALIDRYIRLFGTESIEGILADREFIGDKWIGGLADQKIRFYFRIKGNMWIDLPGKGKKKAFWLFRAMKTSGFNLEDTHLNDLERISKLLCLVCIAFIWAYLAGIYKHIVLKPIRILNNGRKAHSTFRYGLDYVAHALLCSIKQDIKIIVKILSCT
ncbi:MAG: IS4 family transposase [Bacteroidota bacterium]|nr:IS4 family transposase [Bacteroidota bacterium]